MDKLLQVLYDCFYTPRPSKDLTQLIEEIHRELIERLSKEDRKRVLQIIDTKDKLIELQSIDSFIRGFQLATQLAMELECYGETVPVSHTRFNPNELFIEGFYTAGITAENK